jgi:hypothetical protein
VFVRNAIKGPVVEPPNRATPAAAAAADEPAPDATDGPIDGADEVSVTEGGAQ